MKAFWETKEAWLEDNIARVTSEVGLLAEKGEGLVAANFVAIREGGEVPRQSQVEYEFAVRITASETKVGENNKKFK